MSERFTWHGGGLAAARAAYGEGDWLDLSTGINPHGWPVPDLGIDWTRLPEEPALLALERAAAAHFGVDPAYVCALPGTEIGLRLVGQLIGGPAVHGAPGYRTHGDVVRGSRPVDATRLDAADGGTLILANPANPDGRRHARADLRALLARRGEAGWLIVDEAFADADPCESVADHVASDRRLLVFRSFGKFFGLAGVRLGFLLGPPHFLSQMRHLLGAWPLSAAAIAIGEAAYRDRPWIAAMQDRLRAEATALDALLARAGYRGQGACSLFRLIDTDDAFALFERLAAQTILTRPFAENPRWLRIGLPADAAASARLEAALHG
ncbi:MAG: aminotransferase class I/II-fold pyridoxal phosphate-dependent enzyme [Sphingobium sp.]